MQSKPQRPTARHHYLPEFYLKRWTGFDRKLVEYSCRDRLGVVSRSTAPGGTGWQKDLYKAGGMPLEVAYAFEEHFFAPVDSLAAETLTLLEERGAQYPYTIDHRRAWSRFVVSLLTRSPEDIITLKRYWRETILSIDPAYEAEYAEAKGAEDPATLSEFLSSLHPGYLDGSMFKTMSEIIDGGRVSEDLATMHWTVLGAPSGATGLLTSDRPLLWSDRFGGAEGHVAMPIGPKRLFVAARDPKFVGQLIGRGTVEELVRHVNTHVVQGARRFVYSQDQAQSRFIKNRFGTKRNPSVIERLIAKPDGHAVQSPAHDG